MRVPLALALAAAGAAPLAAQDPRCQGTLEASRNACNAAIDAARVFHPVAGVLVSGGNPVLASGGALGGLGRWSLSGRVNAVRVSLPDPDSAAQRSVPSAFEGWVPAPVVETSVGILPGIRRGLLAVDLLGSAVLLPTGVEDLTVDAGAARIGDVALGLGYGVRLGILQGDLLVPALSLSLMRRHLPGVQYGDVDAGAPSDFAANLRATNWRLAAGMSFAFVAVAAGFGVDRYASTARIRYDDIGTTRTVRLELRSTRQVLFLDAGVSLGLAQLTAELGYQTGADQRLNTDFSDFDPSAGHVFWSAGLRCAF
ncbi:MAG TPA: hypothetical protein VNI61_10750 [Gemmatimonadales bacterium]|nr:hypothetical protein [Gemmatimonadales bacterium]